MTDGGLVSFDIDGTLEVGDPVGPIPVDLIRTMRSMGWIVGTASDWALSSQRRLWANLDLDLHFVGGKHDLAAVRGSWDCTRYVHIGDTAVDRHYAAQSSFEFVHVDDVNELGLPVWSMLSGADTPPRRDAPLR